MFYIHLLKKRKSNKSDLDHGKIYCNAGFRKVITRHLGKIDPRLALPLVNEKLQGTKKSGRYLFSLNQTRRIILGSNCITRN